MYKIVLLIVLVEARIDWCNTDLCQASHGPHVSCNNNGHLGEACPAQTRVVRFTPAEKMKIVNMHNRFRNAIALGKVPRYKTASRMKKMKWSNALAHTAVLNVKTCKYEHDCHNTRRYPRSGQNLYFHQRLHVARLNEPFVDVKSAIKKWANEHKACNMSYIRRLSLHKRGLQINHFAVMVQENNNRVGCSAVRFTVPFDGSRKNTTTLVTCNYAEGLVLGTSVYRTGHPASRCPHKRNAKFKGLC